VKILVIEDEKNIRIVLRKLLEDSGFKVTTLDGCGDLPGEKFLSNFSAIITDFKMPSFTGMDIVRIAKPVKIPVIMLTAYGNVEIAVEAMKLGAFDFLTKPFDRDDVINVVSKSVSVSSKAEKEIIGAQENSIIGNSELLLDALDLANRVAGTESTVLVTGESGTGKELVAEQIHNRSNRREKAFIKVNCAAIPENLIESDLFGHTKGAFSGAVTDKPGRFEVADSGTIFLDEIGDMPLEMQAKLLRVLQEGEFERVGGIHTLKVDVRVVAATNRDLQADVKSGRFREDLYYRLNVIPIHLPPLRERRADIDSLVDHFLEYYSAVNGNSKVPVVSEDIRVVLRTFEWPGNIRQLQNLAQQLVILRPGCEVTLTDLPREMSSPREILKPNLNESDIKLGEFKSYVRNQTRKVESEFIEEALERTGGNVTQAADLLGLSRKGLQIKIKDLEITGKGHEPT